MRDVFICGGLSCVFVGFRGSGGIVIGDGEVGDFGSSVRFSVSCIGRPLHHLWLGSVT